MTVQVAKFEAHRAQLAESLTAVADSMRNCAQIAETFAKIVKDTSYSPEAAEMINGALEDHSKGKRKAAIAADEDGTKKRKRATKVKDPNAPKRPPSSYILFQNDIRADLKSKFPDISNAELLGMISEQWKAMPEEDKEKYNQRMNEAKTLYVGAKKAYDNRSPEEVEAANAATVAAQSLKKTKSRGPKAAAAPADAVKARPPPTAEEVSPSTDSSSDEESEEEETSRPAAKAQAASESESSDEEEEEEEAEPVPKKRRGGSAKPPSKSKKSAKA
ncbi:hypothetical protein CPC08DRAFT_715034 [Agrocybe pediades]|nr:hypothetical protein CPC08DRAFT_715034 [Agrocybe pediades]